MTQLFYSIHLDMENKRPTISIIVPVYNVEEYLPYCIRGIQNQTFTDFECILIDDGSTDNSEKICDNICKEDHRFMVIHQENQGYQTARNTGLHKATGSYISFVDADDFIHPQMIEILYQALSKDSSCSFSMAYGEKVYNHAIETRRIENPTTRIIHQAEMIKNLFGGISLPFQVVWNKLYTKKNITKHFLSKHRNRRYFIQLRSLSMRLEGDYY